MESKTISPSRKYFWKIILLTSAAALLVILVLSFTVYFKAQDILLQKEYKSNKKVFDQVKININMMDTMASNLCKYLYMNGDIGAIMYARVEDAVNESTRINRVISTAVSANPYIHSITIYNNYLKKFYNAGQPLFFNDRQLMEMIENKKMITKLKPVSRKIEKLINEKIVYENVFSYFMYENTDDSGLLDGAIAVNISIDWFLDNIKQINMIEKDQGDYVFVLDDNNEFIEAEQEKNSMKKWLLNEYGKYKDKEASDDFVDFFKSRYDGVDYLVTYSYISSMDITIVKVQKLSVVYSSINNLRVSVIFITLIFLAASFLIFTGVSRKIYKPVGKLVQLISSDENQSMGSKEFPDEISYLSDFCITTLEKLNVYDKERYLHKNIMKQYWLNRLLVESQTLETQEVEAIFIEGEITLSHNDSFLVCVFSIDNYKAFMKDCNSGDIELLRFAVINISSEVIGGKYKNEGIDMKEDHIALIIGIPNEDANYLNNVEALVSDAQNHIKKYFKISVSASVSKKTEDIKDITSLYNKAIDNMSYRLIFGHSCIITYEKIQKNENKQYNENIGELEALLIEKIKSADLSEIEEVMKIIFNEIAVLDYDHILISLINLASLLKNSFENLRITAGRHMYFDFNSICQNILENETLTEIYNEMVESIGSILENESGQTAQLKNSYIVDAVRHYIINNYQDSSISLTKISTVLNISTRRISKIFKDEMRVSVSDYINDVRLDKAAELLSSTTLNVKEVISRLGIDNETYFYGMFRKKFGITPKEYSFKRIVTMTQD